MTRWTAETTLVERARTLPILKVEPETDNVIQSFANFEDMLAALDNDRIEADGSVKEWQSTLMPGEYFVRVGPGGVAIYCEVLDPALPASSGPHDAQDLADIREEAKWYNEPHMKNFRFCRAFSLFCVGGELGDVHISTAALKISKENFEAARDHKWRAGFHDEA